MKLHHVSLAACAAAILSLLGLVLPTHDVDVIRHYLAAAFHPGSILPILASLLIGKTGVVTARKVKAKAVARSIAKGSPAMPEAPKP